MKQLLSLTIFIIYYCTAAAQPALQWQKNFGGTFQDQANDMRQTPDGGYIIVGNTLSTDVDITSTHGAGDVWVVKTSATGVLEWQRCYGGSGNESANSVAVTTDGGYIFAGTTQSSDGDVSGMHGFGDYWVVKLDVAGAIEWQKCLGGSFNDIANSIIQTQDGGYMVAGLAGSTDGDVTSNIGSNDYWLVKLSATGAVEWQRSYGGTADDQATCIRQTFDTGYIVTGMSMSNDVDVSGNHGLFDYWVIKLSRTGDIQWSKALGGTGFNCGIHGCDKSYAVIQCADTGYLVSGVTNSIDGDVLGIHAPIGATAPAIDVWITKLSRTGSLEWQKCLGSEGYETAPSVWLTADNGFLIGARTNGGIGGDVTFNHSGTQDYWLVKTDNTGNIEWQKSFGGTNQDDLHFAMQTADGGFAMVGSAGSNNGDLTSNYGSFDFWLVKLGATIYTACDTVSTYYLDATSPTTATVSWAPVPGAIGYEYVVNYSPGPPFGAGTATTDTFATLSSLTIGLNYYLHVRTYCDHGNYSAWTTFEFYTPCDTIAGLTASAITATSALLNWTITPAAYHYEYVVDLVATAPSGTGTSTPTNSAMVSSLLPGTLYYAHVRDSCHSDHYSPWATIPFTTATICDTVSSLSVSGITATDATVSWATLPSALGYQYAINTSATPPLAGTNTTLTSVTTTTLTPSTLYYAHVRDSCATSTFSTWTSVPFTTDDLVGVGNNTAAAFRLSIYPNPASDDISITTVGNLNTNATIQIIDITGRVLTALPMQRNLIQIPIASLPLGTYVIRYTDEERTMVTKFDKR